MVLLYLLIVLLGASVTNAKHRYFYHNKTLIARDAVRNFDTNCEAFHSLDSFDAVPWEVIFASKDASYFYGLGIAVNVRWALTTGTIAADMENNLAIARCYQQVKNHVNIPNDNTVKHKVQEVTKNDQYSSSSMDNNVALVKICPKFKIQSFATLPEIGQTYPCGHIVFPFIYSQGSGPVNYFCNYIGLTQKCVEKFGNDGWNEDKMFCMEDPSLNAKITITNAEIDRAPFVLLGGNFVGFAVKSDEDRYVVVQKMDQFKAWIVATATV